MIRAAAMSSEISMNEQSNGENATSKLADSSDSIESITTTTTTKTTYRQIAPKPPQPQDAAVQPTVTRLQVAGQARHASGIGSGQFNPVARGTPTQNTPTATEVLKAKQQMPIILMSIDPNDNTSITQVCKDV